jgi:carboxyl-terminal processing protease
MVRSASILIAIACVGIACQSLRRGSATIVPPGALGQWRALDATARRDARLRGVWEAEGYGHLVLIDADDIRVFHQTATFCVADAGLVPGFALFSLDDDGKRLSLLHEDYGAASAELQTRVDLRRIPSLPARCSVPAPTGGTTPIVVFDALSTLFQEHYAFFAERRVEWEPLRDRYRLRARLAANTDSLFPVLQEMLGHINDGHLNLSRQGVSFNAGRPALRERLVESWRKEGAPGTSGEYVSSWHRRVVGSVPPLLDTGSQRNGAAGALEWGTIGDSVAYVRINRFSTFAQNNVPRPMQLDSLRAALDRMFTEIGAAKAVIVDVSMNGGGMDAAAILVARRFADRDRTVLTKQVRGGRLQSVVLRPEGSRQFTGPVVVLTSEITASAAEVFVLMMRSLPHVTQVGETTRGILSGLLPKPLPGGLMVTLSHQTVRDADGRLFEATGVPPDEELALFPRGREATGLAEAIREVARRLARAERSR